MIVNEDRRLIVWEGLPKRLADNIEEDYDTLKEFPLEMLNLVMAEERRSEEEQRTHNEIKRKLTNSFDLKKSDPKLEYQKLGKIDEGGFGEIFKVERISDGKIFAMKFIREISRSDMDLAIQEASIISYLQSDELIKYVDMFYFNKQFFIILEYMELSGMKKICVKNYMNHSEDFCRYTLYKVAKGIAAMHKEGILHRDIKSDNILHNKEGEIKIADMGFACVLSSEEQKGEVGTGTTHWIAPEVKKGTLYSKKVDVWSFGCLAYELATGSPPFFDLNRSALTYNVMNIDVPKIKGNWSSEFKDFV